MADTQNILFDTKDNGTPHNSIAGQNDAVNSKATDKSTSNYWAAKSTDEIGDQLLNQIDNYYKYLLQKMFFSQWLKTWLMYYSGKGNNGSTYSGGEQGEFRAINVNNIKSIIQTLITVTVDSRPTWEAQAINGDVKTQKQTILANGLLDYTMRTKRVERDFLKAVEFACIFGEGFVSVDWSPSLGDTLSYTDEGHAIKSGDISYASHEPIDVIRDVRLEDFRSRDWLIVRKYVNKYTLSKQFPNYSDEIESLDIGNELLRYHYRYKEGTQFISDVVPVYYFYHSKTAAIEKGRFTIVLPTGTVLVDTALPYQHIPVGRVSSSDLIGSPFGYSMIYDLTSIQENIDMLYSTILTSQNALGVPNIIVPLGSDLNLTQLAGQLNVLEYIPSLGKPEVLQLLNTPPELPNMIEMLEKKQIELAGLNDVARGNTPSADMSGAALALLDAKAIKLNQLLQWSYVQLLEDVGTWTVEIWKDYAKSPKVATIVGLNNRSKVVEFTGADLEGIDRVIVQSGNPLSKTESGKLQIAQMLLQAGVITQSDEILQLIETGTLDPMIEGKSNELLLIKSENENLADGKMQPVIKTDNHVLHIQEHSSVLADPASREDPSIVSAALDHIQQHIAMLQDPTNSALMMLIHQPQIPPSGGQPPPGGPQAPPAGSQPPMQAQGAPPQAQGPKQPPAGIHTPISPSAMLSQPQAVLPGGQPQLPNAPTIAGTNQKAPLPVGALVKHN